MEPLDPASQRPLRAELLQTKVKRGIVSASSRGEVSERAEATGWTPQKAEIPAEEPPPKYAPLARAVGPSALSKFDVFICHASEDKKSFVEPLAIRLKDRGLVVWYDDDALKLGDRLHSAIESGLSRSRFGIVVLSPSFCRKDWPQRELEGLLALERDGRKVILPIWHEITREEVARFSLILADRVALPSTTPLEKIVDKILDVISPAGTE